MTEHKTDMTITETDKYKQLNMTEHKTDMNITKIQKHKKLKVTEHKTDMNITEIDKYKETEQHFYDGTQNRIQLHFSEPNNKHIQIQQSSSKPQNTPQKGLTKIFNQQLTSIHFLYL